MMNKKEEELTGQDESAEENGMLYEHFRLKIDPGQKKSRIDKFLCDRLPGFSRSKIRKALEAGRILVNEDRQKQNYSIRPGDEITLSFPEPPRENEIVPQDIPLDILHEDPDLLIVNKKAGMVVHPAQGNRDGTLVNALTWHFGLLPEMPGNTGRPGLVHRIDKDTSGLLVIAKNENTVTDLGKQFYDHSIRRSYLALVWGEPKEDKGTINAPLGRNPKDRRIVTVYEQDNPNGKYAITHYRVLKRLRYVSLIECRLETGRTHQIRAHMKHIGHTLFGDTSYGGNKVLRGTTFSKYKAFVENCFKILPRQALHAQSLGFIHPADGRKVFFESPLPADFAEVLEKWEHYLNYN